MVARVFVCYKNERQKQKDSPNQGSNLGPYPGKRIHILLIKARCEGYVITATLSGRLIGWRDCRHVKYILTNNPTDERNTCVHRLDK